MTAYLLDTNHVGLAVDRASIVGRRLFEARLAGIRVGTCLPVLCEIEAGMRASTAPDEVSTRSESSSAPATALAHRSENRTNVW